MSNSENLKRQERAKQFVEKTGNPEWFYWSGQLYMVADRLLNSQTMEMGKILEELDEVCSEYDFAILQEHQKKEK